MERLCVKNGRLVLPRSIENNNLIIENGKIAGICDYVPESCKIIDAAGKYVTPGIIELHAHGGGGYDFCDSTAEAFEKIVKTHLKHGTTLICPTAVSSTKEKLYKLADAYRVAKAGKYGKFIHKLHLEGPYLNPLMCGAQRKDIIRNPKSEEVDELFGRCGDIIGRIGCAPEISGVDYLAKKAVRYNILLSIAHSAATAEETIRAIAMGFTHVTHLYSATTTVRKINQRITAGILEVAYLYDDMFVELIGDGRHVAKETMQMAVKIKGTGRINLTSDAMRAAGQSNITESYLGEICPENRVLIDDNVAKLADMSSYAGSIATGDIMLKNAVLNYGIDIVDATRMLTLTPAVIIGANKKGSIENGKDADLVIWNNDFSVAEVIVS